MDTLDQSISSSQSGINSEIKEHILTISKWAKFLAIIGFIGVGLMIIAVLGFFLMSSELGGALGIMVPLLYIVFAAIYFFPVYYLYKGAIGLRDGINLDNEKDLTEGFKNLKSHYKFLGIATIIVISIYILILIGSLFALSATRF